jgi:hypothetical protein
MRALLVTPWFAAGVGILIAAAMALAAPKRAVLSYGPVDPGILCRHLSCALPVPRNGPGSLASAKPGIQLPLPSTIRRAPAASAAESPAGPSADTVRPSATPRPAAPAGVAVRYVVLRHGHGTFLSVITVQSSTKLGAWSLGFVIPGARISDVWGGKWRPSVSDSGGVVSGRPWPWARPGPGTAKIVIFATGRPRPPADCTFDGEGCVFS